MARDFSDLLVGLVRHQTGHGQRQQGKLFSGRDGGATARLDHGAGGAGHRLFGGAHHHEVVAVVGDGGGERGGPVEADASDEADGVAASLAVALYDGDLAHVLIRVESHKPLLDRKLHPTLLRLDVVLHYLYRPRLYRAALYRLSLIHI